MKKKIKMKKSGWITVIAAAALIAVALNINVLRLALTPDGKTSDGSLPGETAVDEIPEGEIRYLINKNIYFEHCWAQGNIMFENPVLSRYSLKLSIYNEKGNLIYASPMLEPGQYVQRDKLKKVLKPGTYNCSYAVNAYDRGEYCGQYTGTLTICVE